MRMSGESPYHTMSEGETAMDVDSSEMSLYQMEVPGGVQGMKAGLELTGPVALEVPVPVSEEVVISGPGVPSDPAQLQIPIGVQEDQEVEEFMLEIPLDVDDENSSDSVYSSQEAQAPVYTVLEPCHTGITEGTFTSQLLSASMDDVSVDSGLGSSERSSILSKKNNLTRLPSQDEDSCDLSSWTQLHPDNWTSKEVLDWLYHLAEQDNTNIDENQLKGEAFKDIDGATLCRWSRSDFIKADPRHGVEIYENFSALCGMSGDFIAPDEITESTGYDHQDFMNPLISAMEDGSSPLRSDVDPYLPDALTEINVIVNGQNYTIDAQDRFDDVQQNSIQFQSSGVHTSFLHGSGGGLVQKIAASCTARSGNLGSLSTHTLGMGSPSLSSLSTQARTATPTTAAAPPSTAQTTPKRRGRGRPRKNSSPSHDEGSDGEYSPKQPRQPAQRGGPRGKRPHSNRMLHLWEFIRDLLLDSRYNPHLIRWENRREGVFRVVRSKEVAKMWGVRKQNPEMTYEKFSRSMRFCRTAEYFGEVPKDGKYPKKLCFAFGPRAHGWQPNSVVSQAYYARV